MESSSSNNSQNGKVLILANGNHRIPMRKLKAWLEKNLPQYSYKICGQFFFRRRVQWTKPKAIITYNKNLMRANTVKALKQYTKAGGILLALHHNVSSMMLRRPEWLEFTGIKIEKGEDADNRWSVIEGGDLYLTNLQKEHPITTKNVEYGNSMPDFDFDPDPSQPVLTHELSEEEKQNLKASEGESRPAILFESSEYFINHVPVPEDNRTFLFGQYFNDQPSGRQFYSANGGWMMPKGKGWLFYLMPGHSSKDYNENYCNIIKNCITYKGANP